MKGTNGEQFSVHPRFKTICKQIMNDWNAKHKEQVKQQKKNLTLQRLSLSLAKLLETKKEIYDTMVNAEINLEEW